ncbi:MAG: hypothetical protein IJC43_05060 [Clostridia bacterium]|nr:hypothetical protein [Clostridia bacterium]
MSDSFQPILHEDPAGNTKRGIIIMPHMNIAIIITKPQIVMVGSPFRRDLFGS